MSRDLKDWSANHVIAWGGCMNPIRLHSQGYRPMPKGNAFQRLMRKLFRVTEPKHRAPFLNDNDMGL